MKKVSLILVVVVVSFFFLTGKTYSKLQPYYSGDAVNFNNKVIIATTNSGNLEVFKLENGVIAKTLVLNSNNPAYNQNGNYSDVKLSVENNQLYAYLTSSYTLYKYNISSLDSAQFEKKVQNTYWDWYQRVDRLGDNIVTISDKRITIFNSNLNEIDSFVFSVSNPYSIRSNGNNQYVFAIDNNTLEVYDRVSRLVVRQIPLNFNSPDSNHKAYYDITRNELFAVDDIDLKKFDLSGNLLDSLKHLDQPAYDVESSFDNPYVYFSNGVGVVKVNKDSFKISDYAFTSTLGGPQGWAMGMKLVNTDSGDIVVVFNGPNILLLNNNLQKIDSIKSDTNSPITTANENLYLNLTRNWSLPNSLFTVSGGGFWAQEPLTITLGGKSYTSQADNSGRFTQDITTPILNPGHYDIKVTGTNSNFTYSAGVEIK